MEWNLTPIVSDIAWKNIAFGLYIVLKFVKIHEAQISIDSATSREM